MSHRPAGVAGFAILVVALSLLVAGCGGRASPKVASVASSTTPAETTTTQNAAGPGELVAFSTCMRTHGDPSFPGPQSLGGHFKLTINPSPQFQTAMTACRHLLPTGSGSQETGAQQQAKLAGELSFAKCMRSHGVSRFPDPNAQGQLTVAMVQAQGIDVHSSTVLNDAQTCLPASHGWLTAGKVSEAIKNAGR
jgi:hypothetical protein